MTVRKASTPDLPEHAGDKTPEALAQTMADQLGGILPTLTWSSKVRWVPEKEGYGLPVVWGHLGEEEPSDDFWVLQFIFMGIDPYSYKRDENYPKLKYGPIPARLYANNESPVLDWSWIDTMNLPQGQTAPKTSDLADAVASIGEALDASYEEAQKNIQALERFADLSFEPQ